MSSWGSKYTSNFESWVKSLKEEKLLVALSEKIQILLHFGPGLGRPLVDTLKESKFKNMKELRFSVSEHVVRVFFVFDPKRKAVFLIGGEKQNNKRFYKEIIPLADKIYQEYLEGENK